MTKLALLVVFAVFIVITIIVWIIHLIRHKKKAALAVISCLTVFVVSFCVIFPTSFPFVDSWIIGKTLDEIVSVYGDNYKESITGTYSKAVSYPIGGIYQAYPINRTYCYCIYLDSNNVAVRIKKEALRGFYRCGGVSSY